MFERFTDRVRKIMALAHQDAQRFNHDYVDTEHILLGLVKEGTGAGANVLHNLDVDLLRVRLEVEKRVNVGPAAVAPGRLPQSQGAKKVVEYAVEESRNLDHDFVGTEHFLLGLLREERGMAAQVLTRLGLTLERAREEVLELMGAGSDTRESRESTTVPRPTTVAAKDFADRQSRNTCPGCQMCTRIDALHAGQQEPSFITELSESYVMLADTSGPYGSCILILKSHAEHLADLPIARQLRLYRDVASVSAALRTVFPTAAAGGGPAPIHCECSPSVDSIPHVHWHVIPLHADSPRSPLDAGVRAERPAETTYRDRVQLIQDLRAQLLHA